MSLSPGSRLGPYEVLAPLGAGGMGEVYRARDSRLNREVAVKVIAGEGASNPDRVERFVREARAVAAVEHPHIVAVHDAGTEDGRSYVVFELLQGETLRERLERAPLPSRRAMELAGQICQGLAAAHTRGIVHRDLKPENLFLTRDGRIKVFDFGLARLTEPVAMAEDGDATASRTLTERGSWVGTPGYVSPEQLRGGAADARSDIFALGAVLYEMLSGRRAFKGRTSADTLTAVLERDPAPLASIDAAIPPSCERLVRRCLEKDPEGRFQSARDVAFAIDTLGDVSPIELAAGPARRVSSRRFVRWAAAAAAGLALLALGAFLARFSSERPPPTFAQLTFRRGFADWARFASDGHTVLYAAGWEGRPTEIFQMRTDNAESRPLGLTSAKVLAVSSAGQMAILLDHQRRGGFIRSGTLAVVPVGGSAPRELAQDVLFADWTPDGRELCVVRGTPAGFQMELPLGNVIQRSPREIEVPRVSPDGRRVAFYEGRRLLTLELTTQARRTLVDALPGNYYGLAWTPSGEEVWYTAGPTFESRDILAVNLAGRQRLVYRPVGSVSLLDISREGRVLLHRNTEQVGVVALGPGAAAERELSILDSSRLATLSADGRTVLLNDLAPGPEGRRPATFVRSTLGGEPIQLGVGEGTDLSPDGRFALVVRDQGLVEVPLGPGLPRHVDLGPVRPQLALYVPPDGKRILVVGSDTVDGTPDLWLQEPHEGKPRRIRALPPFAVHAALSPDGRHFAASFEAGAISMIPLDGGEPRILRGLPVDRLFAPYRFSGDGRALFLRVGSNFPCQIHRLDLGTGRADLWKQIVPTDPTGIIGCNKAMPSADGRSYAYQYLRVLNEVVLAEGLQ